MTTRQGGFIYLLQGDGGFYKIGKSKNPEIRHRSFTTLPYNVRLLHQIATDDARWLESHLHGMFAEQHVVGEWFSLRRADVKRIVGWVMVQFEKLLRRTGTTWSEGTETRGSRPVKG